MYLVLYNVACFAIGFLLVICGFFLTGQKDQLYDIYGCTFPMSLLIVITAAIAITAVASDSAYHQSGVRIGGFQTLILVLAILLLLSMEISGFLAGFVMQAQVEKEARQKFLAEMRAYSTSNGTGDAKQWIDLTQQALGCCGIDSPKDWLAFEAQPPASCCAGKVADCASPFPVGCAAQIHAWLSTELRAYSLCCLGAAALQICGLGAIFARRNRQRIAAATAAVAAASASAYGRFGEAASSVVVR